METLPTEMATLSQRCRLCIPWRLNNQTRSLESAIAVHRIDGKATIAVKSAAVRRSEKPDVWRPRSTAMTDMKTTNLATGGRTAEIEAFRY